MNTLKNLGHGINYFILSLDICHLTCYNGHHER
jgi:hypothetical protein